MEIPDSAGGRGRTILTRPGQVLMPNSGAATTQGGGIDNLFSILLLHDEPAACGAEHGDAEGRSFLPRSAPEAATHRDECS
tara:strand:+ start:10168 stop:10410 length:243 start_codon:yes stop_codon:yes gene_type:complete